MGKIVYALLLAFVTQFALVLFAGQNFPGSSLYNFLLNPTDWEGTLFIGAINDILLLLGGASIIAGLYFIRNEFILYLGLAAVFFSFGISFYNAWQFINQQAILGEGAVYIASLVMAPIILVYIILVLDFARGKD